MSGAGQTALTLGFNLNTWRDTAPSIKDGPSNAAQGGGCMTDRSHEIPQDLLRPRCISLHIRPLGVCSRFADRGLSVFVIEGLPLPRRIVLARPAAARDTMPGGAAVPSASPCVYRESKSERIDDE